MAKRSDRPSERKGNSVPENLRTDLKKLPRGSIDHCVRVAKVCRDLASRFRIDSDKAEAAALVHDIARTMSDSQLRELATRYGLGLTPVDENLPLLAHGPIGAAILRAEYGITDEEILGAVACHTTGKAGMKVLDKILFLADKLEPQKVGSRPELESVRELAEKDLDQALLKFLDLQLIALISGGSLVHPAMVEARNDILIRLQDLASTRYHKA